MWGWSNPLVEKATDATYHRVFTVFGAITLGVIGLYLLWRSRQSEMNNTMTTAGWAILVMVAITALAHYPVRSAELADNSLIGGLNAVHGAVGPPTKDIPPDTCAQMPNSLQPQCKDHRTPAQRASDVAVYNVLYRDWLRGTLGSADSETARKYGPILYDSKSLTWSEYQDIKDATEKYRSNPNDPKADKTRKDILSRKQAEWQKVAKRIKIEDPAAYQYLQGTKGMDRIGAGFVAVLSALFFALFDITASILVLLGFLIFRWAVIAAPVLGTVGMLRPASTGIRRLLNAVIAAIFNIIIFGTGAAIYLFAVDIIMSTATLPAWLQIILILLTGVVGWLLLRPYRRITQLGGSDSARQMATASGHRSFFRDLRTAATLGVATPAVESMVDRRRGSGGPIRDAPSSPRPETRTDPVEVRTENRPRGEDRSIPEERTAPATRQRPQWREPEYADPAPTYSVYRPANRDPGPAVPGRRPESADVRG
jgi:drug/metabolite transporter (DMT)-like permease